MSIDGLGARIPQLTDGNQDENLGKVMEESAVQARIATSSDSVQTLFRYKTRAYPRFPGKFHPTDVELPVKPNTPK